MRIFVSGTDTDVGKTIVCAALTDALRATYWKPIQAGGLEQTDSDTVRKMSGVPSDRIEQEAYRLKTPCSPHRSAELDGLTIDWASLSPPDVDPLIVEGAGGLMVPVTREILIIDLIARWKLPVVLVSRTSLGTINHSLLSIQALRAWKIPLLGIAFVGDSNRDSEQTICDFGQTKRLGRLPRLNPLNEESLRSAFHANFSLEDFR